ncbi:MAG TPA: TlpA disulfide reductase family protein, partial [Chitinophagaceae bacterium]|nr:TlpA disulfide reductase family protein [Chitinophagaceae bacterium]
DLKAGISHLPENSWYYSTYLKHFKPSSEKRMLLIKANTIAPDWEAVYFNAHDTISLSKFKGKVVLLEFWIKNCGYCIAAVPELNSLIEKHKSTNFTVIGINRHDKQEDVNFFYQKNQPNFKTVFDNNGSISAAYGIDGFPTIVIIDKKGIVLYAGGLDKELIDRLLKTALE